MTWDLADENEKSKMNEMERVELYEWAQNSEASEVQAETKELFVKLPEDLQEEARAGSMIMTVRAGSQKESDAVMKTVMGPRECVSIKGKPADGKLLRFHAVRNVDEKDKKLWPEKVLTQDGKAAVDSPEKGLGMEVVGVITIDSDAMQTLEGAGETREEFVLVVKTVTTVSLVKTADTGVFASTSIANSNTSNRRTIPSACKSAV